MNDKNFEDLRNGRRSHEESPESQNNSDGSDSDQEGGMRIGDDYQAVIPNKLPAGQKYENTIGAMLVWAPCCDIPEAKVDKYISVSKEKHGYNTEQALGMLFWHKHNIDKALSDLANFTPFPDEWSVEDKVLFEQAFSFHGKAFQRIRQMLPEKSIPSLVKYFYSWKKTRSRTSLMDRHAKRHKQDGENDTGSELGSNNSDEEMGIQHRDDKDVCSNCGLSTASLHETSHGSQCNSCFQYWRRTGVIRSAGPKRHESTQGRHNPIKHKRKPPKGMHLDAKDLTDIISEGQCKAESMLKTLDSDVVSLKRQVQNNKQLLGLQKHKLINGVDSLRIPETVPRVNSRWTNEELLLAVQGVRKYGKNFQAIAEVIGNKQEVHVRSFFINFRRRYNLDEVLDEYEAEHGTHIIPDDEDEDHASTNMEAAVPCVVSDAADKLSVSRDNGYWAVSSGENAPQSISIEHLYGSATPVTIQAPCAFLKQPAMPLLRPINIADTIPYDAKVLPLQKTILQQPPPLVRPALP